MTAAGTGKPRRADAVRNRERVVSAAEAEFAEHGFDAGIPGIAARAGVGKGTIYRNFESKEELIAAVASRRLERFDRLLEAALEGPSPFAALRQALHEVASRSSGLTLPVGIVWPVDQPELNAARSRVRHHLSQLFRAAQEDGDLRRDAAPEELLNLFGGACRALRAAGESEPAVWRRHTDLVLDAFRP